MEMSNPQQVAAENERQFRLQLRFVEQELATHLGRDDDGVVRDEEDDGGAGHGQEARCVQRCPACPATQYSRPNSRAFSAIRSSAEAWRARIRTA